MAEQSTPKADPKMTARFFARSAARLERLLIINAPQPIVENELKTARNRLTELEAAHGVDLPDGETVSPSGTAGLRTSAQAEGDAP